jgi:hypothetical protein
LLVSSVDPTLEKEITEEVIQVCMHDELAAAPDPTDDGIIADVMWSTHVENNRYEHASMNVTGVSTQSAHAYEWLESDVSSLFQACSWNENAARPSEYGAVIFVVKFNRVGQQLRAVLHEGPELETVRAAAKAAGHSCEHARSGASVFLYPAQYPSVLAVLAGVQLRPHHVVISEAFLPLLMSEISAIPSKQKMRPRSWQTLALVDGENDESMCVVEHGFYNSTPHLFYTPDSVTQSTSEAPPNRVLNVRRHIVD